MVLFATGRIAATSPRRRRLASVSEHGTILLVRRGSFALVAEVRGPFHDYLYLDLEEAMDAIADSPDLKAANSGSIPAMRVLTDRLSQWIQWPSRTAQSH